MRTTWVRPVAASALIVVSVLVVLHNFVIRDVITVADVRTAWLPIYCFLGKSLTAGHLPAWNPYSMTGMPFAADPQSGWMYLPAMTLFTALPCDVAIRAMIVLQPILAGLGMYAFLRSEDLSWPAATTGGLVLALVIAGSSLSLSLPFAGTLAWTAVLLACCSRFLRAPTWAGRLGWCLATAAAWGQLAAAHFSIGLILGSAAMVALMAAKAWQRRSDYRSLLAQDAVLVGALPLVNLAYLLPRLVYLPRTSISLGYERLQELSAQLAGLPSSRFEIGQGAAPAWPLKLATSPGAHLGALALVFVFSAWWLRRHRPLVVSFFVFAVVLYLFSLDRVARVIPGGIRSWKPVDLYLHNPQWLGYGVVVALSVLAGIGLDAWRQEPSRRRRLVMLSPGVAVFGVLPLVLGASFSRMAVFGLGLLAGAAILMVALERSTLVTLVPAVLALELIANSFFASGGSPFRPIPALLGVLAHPKIPLATFVTPDRISRTIQEIDQGRYVTIGAPGPRGQPSTRLQALNTSMLYRIESIGGYNPVQLRRYWMYVRATEGTAIRYNRASFGRLDASLLDLLQVHFIVATNRRQPVGTGPPLVVEGISALYPVEAQAPRASLLTSWMVAPTADAALSMVAAPTFDPSRQAVLEEQPGIQPTGGSSQGTLSYAALGMQSARVTVDTPDAALLLVRNSYDPNWHATVDGRATPVLPADYVAQGVIVPAGRHVVVLRYEDPTIGYGLLGSAVSVTTILMGIAAFAVRARRRAGRT
jgi:hypothetical protein